MKEIRFLVEHAVEGGYTARAFDDAIFTEADTFDALREMVRDAVHCHFDDDERPSSIHLRLAAEND